MPNIAGVLREEILRLAKKEIRQPNQRIGALIQDITTIIMCQLAGSPTGKTALHMDIG